MAVESRLEKLLFIFMDNEKFYSVKFHLTHNATNIRKNAVKKTQ